MLLWLQKRQDLRGDPRDRDERRKRVPTLLLVYMLQTHNQFLSLLRMYFTCNKEPIVRSEKNKLPKKSLRKKKLLNC